MVGGCNSWEARRVEGGISFIEARKRLDSQSDTLTREITQPSGISWGESSSESVASPASLKSQAWPFPVSPIEPQILLKDHPICAAGNTVHSRSSAKTKMEENERIVTTASYKYEDDEVVNKFVEILKRAPMGVVVNYNSLIIPFPQPRLQEQLLLLIVHERFSRSHRAVARPRLMHTFSLVCSRFARKGGLSTIAAEMLVNHAG